MAVEIRGINITDIAYANALSIQGFISDVELENARRTLGKEPTLKALADNANREIPKTIVGKAIKWVGKRLTQN